MRNSRSRHRGAKTIVDIYDGNSRSAAIQHRQQRRDALE
jgi:hypothetical protein